MQIECSHCKKVLEFSDDRPAFCAYCGHALPAPNVHQAATVAHSPSDSSQQSTVEFSAEVPKIVGSYRLIRELGRGGMGVVWEAEQMDTGRAVALKLLSPQLPRTPETLDRFLREGRLAAALSHPRSTFVFGAGEHQGQPYIAMELMPGKTLKDVVDQQGALPVQRAVDYMMDVIEGLEAAHAIGVIHRDVKPSNCFLDSDGRVKVGDFGLSKSLVNDAALTRTGAFMGTPLFAAPEQVRAGKVDERTDTYAVGATLFYLIARRGPFTGDSAAVIAQISSDPAPSLRSLCPAVPPELDQVVARCLEKDPARRFANLSELRHALLPHASGGIQPAPIAHRLAAYFVDVTLAGLVAVLAISLVILFLDFAVGWSRNGFWGNSSSLLLQFLTQASVFALMVAYFAIAEGRWAAGVGKRLMGLRVDGMEGVPVGLGRALVRALFFPGLMTLLMGVLQLLATHWGSSGQQASFDPERLVFQQVAWPMAFVPLLLCLITMRANNGYRGAHDLVSGTHVVRLRSTIDKTPLRELPVAAPLPAHNLPASFGPYRVVGLVGQFGAITVLQAWDDTLERPTWIYVRKVGAPPLAGHRVGLTRTTRPRWLQGGGSKELQWDAFEAVTGAPLVQVAGRGKGLAWEHARIILLDLAEELVQSLEDETVPTPLTLDQVWVHRGGRAKVVEVPLRTDETDSDFARGGSALGPEERTLALFRSAVQLCIQRQVLPGHAQDFLAELAKQPDKRETLDWASERLREIVEHPTRLRWTDRLVTIGVSLGTEYPLYQVLPALLALVTWSVPGLPTVLVRFAPALASLVLPAAVGYWLGGGPVFWFMDVEVRRADGRTASRLRCAWRSLLAWAPVMAANGISVAFLPSLAGLGQASNALQDSAADSPLQSRVVLIASVGLLLLLIQLTGAVYAVVRPQRGVQDLLAGTRLAPR